MTITIEPVIVRLRERRCGECGRFWACEFEFHGVCPICAGTKLEAIEKKLQCVEAQLRALQGAKSDNRKRKTREKA